jgi:hypothetical protein
VAEEQSMREVLYEDEQLVVALEAGDQGLVVDLRTSESGPDLTTDDEVVVVVDGQGCPLEIEGPRRARATVVEELPEEPSPTMLMVRVFEFFEGWELFVD